MIYTAVAREIWTRLEYHRRNGIAGAPPLLEGLKVVKSGEFRIDSEKDLPQTTLVDLTGREVSGRSESRFTLFLKTARKRDWVKLTDDGPRGLLDWMELLMDAVEIAPSTGQPDPLLIVHRLDGSAIGDNHGQPLALLTEPFSWDYRMSEITDMAFLMELDIAFSIPKARRANRRTSPIPPSAYVV